MHLNMHTLPFKIHDFRIVHMFETLNMVSVATSTWFKKNEFPLNSWYTI